MSPGRPNRGKGLGTRPASGGPIRPPVPPTEPGNVLALIHGASSARVVRPVADALERGIEELVAGTPAAGHAFAAARGTLATRLARLQLVSAFIDREHGGLPIDAETGAPLPIAALEAQLLVAVDKSLDGLGLTPRAAASLGVDLLRGSSLQADLAAAFAARDRADSRMSDDR